MVLWMGWFYGSRGWVFWVGFDGWLGWLEQCFGLPSLRWFQKRKKKKKGGRKKKKTKRGR